ncbi:MAG: peptidoglycan-binding protein [Burkholderiales bacterium]|nr:peptidoglycan-binding protein [Burkholderiales bacterium]
MKATSIAAAVCLALAGTAAIAAGDQQRYGSGQSEHSGMQGRTGATGAQGQFDSQTIRQVQQQLKQQGHDVQTDGQMGPKTQAALKKFQQQQGLSPTGQLDQQTLSALGIQQSGSMGASGRTGATGSSSDTPSGSSPGMSGGGSYGGSSGGSSPGGSYGGSSSGSMSDSPRGGASDSGSTTR